VTIETLTKAEWGV